MSWSEHFLQDSEQDSEEERTRRVDDFLAHERQRRQTLFAQFIQQCQSDPLFLDRALKTLRPLRGRGRSKAPPWHQPAVQSIITALTDWDSPGEIVQAIACALNISESHARRLYYAQIAILAKDRRHSRA